LNPPYAWLQTTREHYAFVPSWEWFYRLSIKHPSNLEIMIAYGATCLASQFERDTQLNLTAIKTSTHVLTTHGHYLQDATMISTGQLVLSVAGDISTYLEVDTRISAMEDAFLHPAINTHVRGLRSILKPHEAWE
jgi:hypothetical protein